MKQKSKFNNNFIEKRYKTIFENSPSGIIFFDSKGIIIEANQTGLDIFGVTKEQFIGFDLLNSLKDEKLKEAIKISLSSGKAYYKNLYNSVLAKKEIYLEVFFKAIRDEKNNITFVVASLDDQTMEYKAMEKLKKSKEDWKSIIENMFSLFAETDKDGFIVKVSNSVCEISGYERDELVGNHISKFWMDTAEALKTRIEFLKDPKPTHNQNIYFKCKNGTKILVNFSAKPKFDENGDYIGSYNFGEDITEVFNSRAKIDYMATHDALTSLPNRFMLSSILEHSINEAKRVKERFAVVFLDLDNFKNINDNFGHQEGDRVLIEMANRLKKNLRNNDFVCRFGGDEFVILLEHIKTTEAISSIIEKLNKIFLTIFETDTYAHYLKCSMGIAIYPDDASTPEQLLKKSDIAMYESKKKGKNRYTFYSHELGHKVEKDLHIERLLRKAVEKNEFEIYYQPQISLHDDKIIGVEALIRWNSPELGFVSPVEFIPIAEKTHLIIPIGSWVLKTACKQVKKWQDEKKCKGNLSVNISGTQLNHDDLSVLLQNTLEESGLEARFLDLEITESVLMNNAENWEKLFDNIKNMGINISIDDFGTGYSSLSYLRQFPADELKIDKSFIDDIPNKKDACVIVNTIIALAKSLGYKTVAEGVETIEQKEYLKENGCDNIQGYYYSKPLCVSDMEKYFNDCFMKLKS